jgi:hypothetical protein
MQIGLTTTVFTVGVLYCRRACRCSHMIIPQDEVPRRQMLSIEILSMTLHRLNPMIQHKHQTHISIVVLTMREYIRFDKLERDDCSMACHDAYPSTGRVEMQPYMHNRVLHTRGCIRAGRPAIRLISSSALPFSYWPAWANPCATLRARSHGRGR